MISHDKTYYIIIKLYNILREYILINYKYVVILLSLGNWWSVTTRPTIKYMNIYSIYTIDTSRDQ